MSKKALRRKQVEEKTGRSTSWLYEAMAQGKFPPSNPRWSLGPLARKRDWTSGSISSLAERDPQQSEAACG